MNETQVEEFTWKLNSNYDRIVVDQGTMPCGFFHEDLSNPMGHIVYFDFMISDGRGTEWKQFSRMGVGACHDCVIGLVGIDLPEGF